MRSEPMTLRAAPTPPPRGLCFAETAMRSLCVSFHPADIAADLAAAAAAAVTRLHDLPEPPVPVPVILRVRVE